MRRAVTKFFSTVAASLLAMIAGTSLAHPGGIDTNFNVMRVAFAESAASVDAIFALPGNGAIVAGLCLADAAVVGCALKLDSGGNIDPAYGINGLAKLPSRQSFFAVAGFALLPDGKMVVAGACSVANVGWQFCAERLRADGSLDESFGVSGRAIVSSSGSNDGAWAVALQANGKIVMSGQCSVPGLGIRFCTVRLNTDGTIDTNFGSSGFASFQGGAGFQAKAVAVQPDGKIVVTGFCKQASAPGNDFCVQRYLENGSIDPSFGLSGEALAGRSDLNPQSRGLAVQPDSKYIVASATQAARFTSTGVLDTTFGESGVANSISGDNGLQLQPDGRILAGCFGSFCVARYHEDGRLDSGFGQLGYAQTNVPIGSTFGSAVRALLPDGRVLVASRCTKLNDTSKYDVCVTRYLGGPYGYENCKPDLDGDGVVTATVDALILARIALGMSGDAVLSGVNFPVNSTRNNWPSLRNYLGSNCGMKLP